MFERLMTLGDQLLTRLAPRTTAAAAYCRWEQCYPGVSCVHRKCCTGSGVNWCSECQWSCG